MAFLEGKINWNSKKTVRRTSYSAGKINRCPKTSFFRGKINWNSKYNAADFLTHAEKKKRTKNALFER